METYGLIAEESVDMIAGNIAIHLGNLPTHPPMREMKFVKVDGKQITYHSYGLNRSEIPKLDGYDFIGTAQRIEVAGLVHSKLTNDRGLENLLQGNPLSKLPENALPEEIRVILPNTERDSWGVFFKYSEK